MGFQNKNTQQKFTNISTSVREVKVGDVVGHIYNHGARITVVGVPTREQRFFMGKEGLNRPVPMMFEEMVILATPVKGYIDEDEFGTFVASV